MKRNLLIGGAILVVALLLTTLWPDSKPKPKPAPVQAVCSTAANPCIQLQDNNNVDIKPAIKFNDFRFGPQGCIYYRMTTADMFKEYCGGYNMKWIGPGNPPGVESKV